MNSSRIKVRSMGLYIFISETDRVNLRRVSDLEVNELFHDALKHDPSLMISETISKVKSVWFKKGTKEVTYNIYHECPSSDGKSYQARVNFYGSGTKRIVMAYLCGIINGAT